MENLILDIIFQVLTLFNIKLTLNIITLYEVIQYYIKDDNGQVPVTTMNQNGLYSYFVIHNKYVYDTHCAYDQEHFNEFFIDLQKSRNLKLEKIKQIT